jgi:hypothetical protein
MPPLFVSVLNESEKFQNTEEERGHARLPNPEITTIVSVILGVEDLSVAS